MGTSFLRERASRQKLGTKRGERGDGGGLGADERAAVSGRHRRHWAPLEHEGRYLAAEGVAQLERSDRMVASLLSEPSEGLSVLSGGTDTILMERHRMLLFRSVQQFLEEAPPATEALA